MGERTSKEVVRGKVLTAYEFTEGRVLGREQESTGRRLRRLYRGKNVLF